MNHFKLFKTCLFLLCLSAFQLFSLIDLRNRPDSVPGQNIWGLAAGGNNNSADNLKLEYDFIIQQADIDTGGQFIIDTPGRYCLETDMTFTWSAAIRIRVGDVLLDGFYRKCSGQGTGDCFIHVDPLGTQLCKSKDIKEEQVYRRGCQLGIIANVEVKNLVVSEVSGSGIVADSTESLKFKNVKVSDAAADGFVINSCEDINMNLCTTVRITGTGFNFNTCFQVKTNDLLAAVCGLGIFVNTVDNVVMNSCLSCGNDGDGLCLLSSKGIRISDMQFSTNGGSAIRTQDSSDFLYTNIEANDHGENVYMFDGATGGLVQNVTSDVVAMGKDHFCFINNAARIKCIDCMARG